MNEIKHDRNSGERGIALVVVLGFLAVLTIMAIGMAISMRTERLSSSAHIDLVKARIACESALDHAMTNIAYYVGSSPYPLENWLSSPGSDFQIATNDSDAFYHIPPAVWTNDNNVGWVNSTNNLRFAFKIFNCSGLIDANLIGRDEQITLDSNPIFTTENGEIGAVGTFKTDRNQNVRYESVRDMYKLNSGLGSASNLFTFSFSPNGFLRGANTNNLVMVGGDVQTNRTEIIEKLEFLVDDSAWSGAGGAQNAEQLFGMIVDYTDDDFEAFDDDHERASIEPVPMLNEVYLESPTNMIVEVWRPYLSDSVYDAPFIVVAEIDGSSYTSNPTSIDVDDFEPTVVDIVVNSPVTNSVSMILRIKDAGGGILLDEVKALDSVNVGDYWQCNDPRFNYLPNQWRRTTAGTLGNFNSNSSHNGSGDGYYMYCANAEIRTVNQLGYIPVAPWRTLKLYGDNLDAAISYFYAGDDLPTAGRINPNTRQTDPLAAAFFGIDIEQYPGRIVGTLTDIDDLRKLGSAIVAHTATYTNRGDFAASLNDAVFSTLDIEMDDGFNTYEMSDALEMEKESVVGTASRLLNPRQQIYTVVLVGQAVSDSDQVLAEQRAVALVWRDPYPNDDGSHNSFVRWIHWLE